MKWPEVQFADIAEIVTGNTPPKKNPENYGSGVPWVKPPDLDGWEPVTQTSENLSPKGQKLARLLPEGTVMVCCIGSIGRVGIAGTKLATNQQINSLVFGPQVEPRFGYYYCRRIPQVLQAAARNAVVPILNKSNFSKLRMPLPVISEQLRIVEILDQADALRKKRAEADSKAARILPALFYKMFGDPITNPKEWPKSHLTTLCKKVTDGTHDTPKPVLKGYPLVTNKHFINGFIDFADTYNISAEDHAAVISRSKPEHGDILYSQIGSLGTACFVDTTQEFSIKNCALFKPDAKRLSGKWLAVLLNTASFRSYALAQASGGLQKYLSLKILRSFEIINVALEEQLRFEEKYDSVLKICIACKKASHEVDKLFNSILHCAFTGDLTAIWREAHMKELLEEMEVQAKALNERVMP